jgi:hypothetical protein
VLNAKGEKVKVKATGSTTTCVFQKSLCLVLVFYQNPPIAKQLPCGGEIWLWEKGEFLAFDQNWSWKMCWFVKTKCSVKEIRKWICIVKIKQVVAKWSKYAKSHDNSIGIWFDFNLQMLSHNWVW